MFIDQLKIVFSHFDDSSELVSYKELASGHINDTYLVETTNNFPLGLWCNILHKSWCF